MDIERVRALSDTDLATELSNQKRHLYDLRFQLATRQLNDYSQIPQTRRAIARILTVMTERQIEPTPNAGRARGRARAGAAR
jgi:large subunit ribosomal protein L29